MSSAAVGAIFCLIYTTLFSGHYLVVKKMLGTVDPYQLSALRGLFGGLLLFLVFFPAIRAHFHWKQLKLFVLLSLLGFGLNQVLFLQGIQLTTPAHAALISNTIPIVSLFMAILFRQEQSGKYRWAGFVIALLSLSTLVLYQPDLDSASLQGDLLIFASVFCLSASFLLAKKNLGTLPSEMLSTFMLLLGGFFFSLLSRFQFDTVWAFTAQSTLNVWLFLFEVIGSTALAYFLNMAALRRLKLSTATAFSYLQMPITAILSFFFLGLWPQPATFLVLLGLGLAAWLIFLDEKAFSLKK